MPRKHAQRRADGEGSGKPIAARYRKHVEQGAFNLDAVMAAMMDPNNPQTRERAERSWDAIAQIHANAPPEATQRGGLMIPEDLVFADLARTRAEQRQSRIEAAVTTTTTAAGLIDQEAADFRLHNPAAGGVGNPALLRRPEGIDQDRRAAVHVRSSPGGRAGRERRRCHAGYLQRGHQAGRSQGIAEPLQNHPPNSKCPPAS